MSKRDDGLYLTDMWDAIIKIEKYIGQKSFEEFVADDLVYDAVMRQLTILGEAANSVSKGIREQYPDVSWFEIVGLRNRLMHEYSNVEDDIVWGTFVNDLPVLKQQLEKML